MNKFFIMLVFSSLWTSEVMAQCRQVNWPEERSMAEEKLALYGDALKHGNYRDAVTPWLWMLENAPSWHVKLYIDGAKIYNNLAKHEEDIIQKAGLVDTLLWVYDKRIENCGEKIKTLNRKAFSAYKYTIKNKEKIEQLLVLYDELLDGCQSNISDANLVAYMTTVKANHALLNNLSDEDILSHYDKIMVAVNAKLQMVQSAGNKDKEEKLKKYKDIISNLLVDMVRVDCDFVKTTLAPKFRNNPTDIALAKKIFSFMLQGKCTDDPLWLEAGQAILKEEKDFGLIKNIALKYMKNGDLNKAEILFKEGLEIANTPIKKADILIYLGSIATKKGSKIKARQYFKQVSATSKHEKRGYEKTGDLFYSSFNECAKKQNMAEDRLIYIVAYNFYKRAGNSKKMGQAKSQFPSKEEIFLFNWTVGDTMKVGCWINETVTLDTRD